MPEFEKIKLIVQNLEATIESLTRLKEQCIGNSKRSQSAHPSITKDAPITSARFSTMPLAGIVRVILEESKKPLTLTELALAIRTGGYSNGSPEINALKGSVSTIFYKDSKIEKPLYKVVSRGVYDLAERPGS